MRRTIILSYAGVAKLKQIRLAIQRNDGSALALCPAWYSYRLEKQDAAKFDSCIICVELFPKANPNNMDCPCHIYQSSYLIRRLTEIIDYNEKNVEN